MPVHDVIMPKIGMYLDDITLVEWHVAEGAEIRPGQVLFTLETDKVTTDVEAEDAGFLHRLAEPGALVPIGGRIGQVATTRAEYEALVQRPQPQEPPAELPAAQAELFLTAIRSEQQATAVPVATGAAPTEAAAVPAPGRGARSPVPRAISPRARALIARLGLADEVVAEIDGSGPGGRVIDRDVQAWVDTHGAEGLDGDVEVVERRPLRGRRGTVARRMVESLQTAAQLTSVLEVDAADLAGWRATQALKPGYTAIFVALAAAALARHPVLNARVRGDEIQLLGEINVAVAVDTDDGVVAPIVRGASQLSLAEIDAEVRRLAEAARAGTLAPEDVSGGTFTLSNNGTASVDLTTAILNPPQVGILWLGRIRERAVVHEGTIVARPTLQACLTYDHRAVDGVPAAAFLGSFAELVGTVPSSLPLR